jgi:hypothetical protein
MSNANTIMSFMLLCSVVANIVLYGDFRQHNEHKDLLLQAEDEIHRLNQLVNSCSDNVNLLLRGSNDQQQQQQPKPRK